ncbi:MAG: DUF2480 family protein [Flavobacteriaceae bacterium]|nr:DUF2480 family protein [Flavobacteriaceae bacterium]
MSEQGEIRNKVAESGLINIDILDFRPSGKRVGLDLKDFLFEGLILREKDFRQQIKDLETEIYADAYVYLYCSTEAIIPLWAYFLVASKLEEVSRKVIYGSLQDLETLLMSEKINEFDFSEYQDKRVLVRGCGDFEVPINSYVELVQKLKPWVKSLMFGEACSSVPIFKR